MLEDVASVMGCKVGKLPTSYFGLPLGASFNLLGCGMQWKRDSKKY